MYENPNRCAIHKRIIHFSFKKLILLVACMAGLGCVFAQQVTNVQVAKTGDIAIITYDLSGDKPGQTFNIKVECLTGNKKSNLISSLTLSGDLHEVTAGNGKKIEFNALDDLKMMVGDNFMFQLEATEIIKPLPIQVKIQEANNVKADINEKKGSEETVNQEEEPIFIIVEEPAGFQGGSVDSFREWVSQNMVYPLIAAEKGIQGKVYVQFVVNKNGEVVKVKVIRGVDPSLDNESVRVISSSPKWTPAKQGGKNVNQQFVIPLAFLFKDTEITIPVPNEENLSSIKREETTIQEMKPANQDAETAYINVDIPATFRGGDLNSFRVWVEQNLEYPAIAAENGIQGKIFIQFAVNSKGDVVDVKIIRGVDPALDKESIRVIASSPKWIPAKQDGKKVKQQFIIPLTFALQ